MSERLESWRRKLGVAVLLLACFFTGWWARSCNRFDELYFVFKDRTLFLYSGGQRFYVRHNVTSGGVIFDDNVAIGSIRPHEPDPEIAEATGMNVEWHTASAPATDLRLYTEPDSESTRWDSNEIPLTPYWTIVLPLIAVALWLLLSGRHTLDRVASEVI